VASLQQAANARKELDRRRRVSGGGQDPAGGPTLELITHCNVTYNTEIINFLNLCPYHQFSPRDAAR